MSTSGSVAARLLHPLLTPPSTGVEFDGSELPWSRLSALLEAARWADSGWNRQPWRFVVGRRNDATYRHVHGSLTPRNQVRVRGAGALVVAVTQSADERGHLMVGTEYELGLAVARMALQARACGWRTAQIGGFDRSAVVGDFDVPTSFRPFVVVAVGRPAVTGRTRQSGPSRLPLPAFAFTGRWGRPMPTGTVTQ